MLNTLSPVFQPVLSSFKGAQRQALLETIKQLLTKFCTTRNLTVREPFLRALFKTIMRFIVDHNHNSICDENAQARWVTRELWHCVEGGYGARNRFVSMLVTLAVQTYDARVFVQPTHTSPRTARTEFSYCLTHRFLGMFFSPTMTHLKSSLIFWTGYFVCYLDRIWNRRLVQKTNWQKKVIL